VGYGAGVTTHAALTHPVRETVTIELEEAVIEAAPLFRDVARDPLADPRHRFVIEDAGTFLRSTAGRFDVIISEPSNPWLAGVGDLFTREFYRAVSARLEPGGIFCQWVQSYELSPRTLATILRTLAASFPSGHVFRFGADFLIISSASPSLPIDLEKLARGFARTEVRRDLTKIGLRAPKDLLRAYRGRLERLAEEAGPGPINSDDNGWLEHAAPLDLLRSGAPAKLKWTRETGVDLAQAIGGEPSLASRTLVAAANDALARADPGAARGMADALAALGSHDASSIKRRASLLESRKRTRDARRSR
jgi:hypothetical protein